MHKAIPAMISMTGRTAIKTYWIVLFCREDADGASPDVLTVSVPTGYGHV